MSITTRISAAVAGIAFGLLALGAAISSTGGAFPSPTTVVADHHWTPTEPQPPVLRPL